MGKTTDGQAQHGRDVQQAALFDMSPVKKQDADNKAKQRGEQLEQTIARYPEPNTRELADAFLRNLERDKDCDYSVATVITLFKDREILRVTLKQKDEEADGVKFELKVELPTYDRQEYDRKFIKTAVKVYHAWLDFEQQKF